MKDSLFFPLQSTEIKSPSSRLDPTLKVMEAIIGPIVELFLAPIGKQLGYLTFYNRNVKNLKKEVDELVTIKEGLKPKLDAAAKNNENIIPDVLDWQVQVDKVKVEAQIFKRRCWTTSRYPLSRKAKKMTQDVVVVLQQKGEKFRNGVIAYPPSPEWPQLHTTATGESSAGGESNAISYIVNDLLEIFKGDETYLIGIHGKDRVDMKRLVTTLFTKAKDENHFQDGVVVVEHNQRKIQDEIAYWLGLKFDSEIDGVRRQRLHKRLVDNRKKLILFEDVRVGLNLEDIGIPCGGGEGNTRCKIIVTSSEKSICEKMNTQKNYKLEVHKQMLLFGGDSGDLWDDKAHTTIRSIIVGYNEAGICSFQTEYDDDRHWSRSSNHELVPKSTHYKEDKIELRHPEEFLISVSGYYKSESNHVVLLSLKFESNKQTFGPFGLETGQSFASSPNCGKITGFYGRSSHDSLDAIGYYYEEPISSPTLAFGGSGGKLFDDGRYTTIRKLEIEVDSVINSIHIEYDSNGRSRWANLHGSSRGGRNHTVQLDYPDEFIISVSGYIRTVIGSLTIQTNRNKYGPFGTESGEFFSFPSNNIGKIVGFHGSSGIYLDRLGAYIEPFPAQNPITVFAQVGGDGGGPWDDGAAHTTVRQITLKVGHVNVITHLHIEYDTNGRLESAAPHGHHNSHSKYVIQLDYPGEFLISMSGTTRVIYGWRVVSSLIFQSNTRTFGPYGDQSGDPFSTSPSFIGKIVGFHGKSGAHLDSIGVYFEAFSNS